MRVELQEEKAIIVLDGKLDLGCSGELKEKVQAALAAGFKTISLDFTHVSSIDSSGVGKLLLLKKMLKDRGGELIVFNLASEYIQKMFKIIHLDRVIATEQRSVEKGMPSV